MAILWQDAIIDELSFNDINDETEPSENPELTIILRSLFGQPFARGYNTDFTDIKVLSIIYSGAAEVQVINLDNIISSLASHIGPSAFQLYGQIAAIYRQHFNQGRKVRFFRQDESSYQVHLAILKYINKKHFRSNLQFNPNFSHKGLDGTLHKVVYEVTSTWISPRLIKRETG